MKLIPVLDLKSGQMVHARRGDRSAYRPVETPLCRGSKPVEVCRGLLGLHSFTTIYVADLDSIEGTGDNEAVIAELRAAFPDVEFWVDAGLSAAQAQDRLRDHEGALVLGSESQTNMEDVAALLADNETKAEAGEVAKAEAGKSNRVILSLDFRGALDSRGDAFLGPQELLSQTQLWPRRMIVMTLARVGATEGPDCGPDYERLANILNRAEDRQIIAAGGVRHGDDLIRLAGMGVAGVLLASALLDGRVGKDEIAAFHEGHK